MKLMRFKLRENYFERLSRFSCAKKSSLLTFIFSLLILLCSAVTTFAQVSDIPQDTAPPPLKIVSQAEQNQLRGEPDETKRTKLALTLIDGHLLTAETLHAQENYDKMFAELGGFAALIDYTLLDLSKNKSGGNKNLDNYKRVEINLRKYTTRIELLYRDLPAKYEYYVRQLLKSMRKARSRAIEPLFGDTVVKS